MSVRTKRPGNYDSLSLDSDGAGNDFSNPATGRQPVSSESEPKSLSPLLWNLSLPLVPPSIFIRRAWDIISASKYFATFRLPPCNSIDPNPPSSPCGGGWEGASQVDGGTSRGEIQECC